MSFSLAEMLGKKAPTIDIVDVGAMKLDGVEPEYKSLVKSGVARIVGFEPVQAECDKLNKQGAKHQRYLPYFIGDGNDATFHLTNFSMTSSLYEPNTRLLKKFNNLEELTQCVEKSPVKTTRLDDVPEIQNCDYLKLDIQGGEGDAIRGAERLLSKVLVVQTEIEMVPLYKNQPLFGDIDVALRKHGLLFHTFASLMGRAFRPLVPDRDPNKHVKQFLWGDAVYVRSFMDFASLEPEQLLKLAVILNDVMSSFDLAALALQHYDAKTKAGLWQFYMQRICVGGKIPAPPPLD